MSDGHVKVGGTWKALEGIHVKVSGAWKEVQTGYIKVSGAWKEFYTSVIEQTYELSGSTGSPNVTTSTESTANYAGWIIAPTGDVLQNENGTQIPFRNNIEWAFPAVDIGNYWVRWTANAGDEPNLSTPTEGVWTETTSNVQFLWWQTINGSRNGSIKIDIATDSGGLDIIATGYYGGLATMEP